MRILLILFILLATALASQEMKRRFCGKSLPRMVERICRTPCVDVISDIANEACNTRVSAEWLQEKCCPGV
ncbi:unnamed protein product [Caenorhabditis brenneri]